MKATATRRRSNNNSNGSIKVSIATLGVQMENLTHELQNLRQDIKESHNKLVSRFDAHEDSDTDGFRRINSRLAWLGGGGAGVLFAIQFYQSFLLS